MAKFNEILVGRYNRFAQKLFQLKGAAPCPQLASEITLSHPLFHGHENRLIEGWNTYSYSIQLGASVGNANGFRLRNPTGSNVIAVVEKVTLTAFAAAIPELELEPTVADLGTAQVLLVKNRDGRVGNSPTPACRASSAQPAVLLGTGAFIYHGFAPANSAIEVISTEDAQFSIAPGFALNYTSLTANVQTGWVVWWRERALEELERTS